MPKSKLRMIILPQDMQKSGSVGMDAAVAQNVKSLESFRAHLQRAPAGRWRCRSQSAPMR